MAVHVTHKRLENAAEYHDQPDARRALDLIDDAVALFLKAARADGFNMDCADPIERVAEAMALCMVQSDAQLAYVADTFGRAPIED